MSDNNDGLLVSLAEWERLSPESRHKLNCFEKEALALQTRLTTLAQLWQSRPAGLAEYASHYGNAGWVEDVEGALGVHDGY